MTPLTLRDFANGLAMATEIPGYRHDAIEQGRVRAWIDKGYLREHGTDEPSAIVGHLFLTDTGMIEAGITKPVVESQGELF